MVDNGLGVTLLPKLALDAGILRGTDVITRPLAGAAGGAGAARQIGLAWRRGTQRAGEFRLFGDEIGRASCRDRVCQYVKISVVAVSLKKKTTIRRHHELSGTNIRNKTTKKILTT